MKRPTCPTCLHPLVTCYCHTLQRVGNQWPVHILQHQREQFHPLNTARIAQLSLTACETSLLSDGAQATLPNFAINETVLIYPDSESTELTALIGQPTRTLLFLDGSWRKTKRMLLENPLLQQLPKARLQPTTPSRYRIRRTRITQSLSTLEAIVATLEFLEQDEKKYQPLLQSMDWLIDKQIELMGEQVFRQHYGKT